MLNSDIHNIFQKYEVILEAQQTKTLGSLIGAQGGGVNGDWAGSLPKLISILPIGNWKPTSLKRSKVKTRSGYVSDHFEGNKSAYAADFGLNTTFNGRVNDATNFAIKVARNCGANVTSWKPYEGRDFKHYTPDGFRIQIIWLSNVGGNHYDHVHVGVARTSNVGIETNNSAPPNDKEENVDQNDNNIPPENNTFGQTLTDIGNAALDYSKSAMQAGLKGVLNQAWGAIASSEGGKKLQSFINK
jgi:hypothetical protein